MFTDAEDLTKPNVVVINQALAQKYFSGEDPVGQRFGDTQLHPKSIRRSSTWLVGGFAAVALLLGVVGLYGVIAYSVSQRTREIGVRIALGAQRSTVYRLILREAGALALAGIVIGTGCAILAASLMRKLLFGTPPWDIATLVSVAAVLAGSALLASFLPARRAASVNPISALRAQ